MAGGSQGDPCPGSRREGHIQTHPSRRGYPRKSHQVNSQGDQLASQTEEAASSCPPGSGNLQTGAGAEEPVSCAPGGCRSQAGSQTSARRLGLELSSGLRVNGSTGQGIVRGSVTPLGAH